MAVSSDEEGYAPEAGDVRIFWKDLSKLSTITDLRAYATQHHLVVKGRTKEELYNKLKIERDGRKLGRQLGVDSKDPSAVMAKLAEVMDEVSISRSSPSASLTKANLTRHDTASVHTSATTPTTLSRVSLAGVEAKVRSKMQEMRALPKYAEKMRDADYAHRTEVKLREAYTKRAMQDVDDDDESSSAASFVASSRLRSERRA
jgi:hypothetical protein